MIPDEAERSSILNRLFDWIVAGSHLPPPADIPDVWVFKNNISAFDLACEYLKNELRVGAKLPALVERIGVFERDPSVQLCCIKIASRGGGFDFVCPTLNGQVPRIEVGDLVLFTIGAFLNDQLRNSEITSQLNMFGFVTAKLKPEFSLTRGWAVTWARN